MKEAQEEASKTSGTVFPLLTKNHAISLLLCTITLNVDRVAEILKGVRGFSRVVRYKWWMQIILFTMFVYSGQVVATLLGKLYFNRGGKSIWMATLVQTVGFPLMFPFILIYLPSKQQQITNKPSPVTLLMLYMFLGVFLAADCMLYTIGLNALPASTYALLCATQLGFNALFSYLLNGEKFTPFLANSLVLIAFSSALLMFQCDPVSTVKTSRSKYITGFICTIAASAGYGLMLSATQLAFQKIFRSQSYKVVYDLIVYQNMIASVAIVVGLLASGEWKDIKGEMEGYKSGKVSYIMNLLMTAVSWQVATIGSVGLIFEASSLFSNMISLLGVPMGPILAAVFLHEKLNGVKVISTLCAIWGFASYFYQQYLDNLKEKSVNHKVDLTET